MEEDVMTNNKKKSTQSAQAEQPAKQPQVRETAQPLEEELLKLIDDFAEFSDVSAFLCRAYATTLADHERLNQDIIAGARICSSWLQDKAYTLKTDLRHVHARYATEKRNKSRP